MNKMTKKNRTKINYSKKLDAEVKRCTGVFIFHCLDHYLEVAGSTTFGDHDTNGTMENGFSIGINCPPDKMVWSGYSERAGVRYYVYAKDENEAISVWKDAVKKAKAAERADPDSDPDSD